MANKIWNKEKISFLVENYPNYGSKFCAEKLELSRNQIIYKVGELGLKLTSTARSLVADKISRPKPAHRCNVNPEIFCNPRTKEVCYLLGLFWADGYIGTGTTNQNKVNYRLSLELQSDDFKTIEGLTDQTGKWNKFVRSRPGRKTQTSIITHNKVLHEFLCQNNYGQKELGPNIIPIIPKSLLKYWYRGYLDGDGNIYIKNKIIQVSFSAPYGQNWTFMENLSEQLGIKKFGIQRIVRKNGNKYSNFRITNQKDAIKLLTFFYADYDEIGFPRKHEKYIQLIQSSLTV